MLTTRVRAWRVATVLLAFVALLPSRRLSAQAAATPAVKAAFVVSFLKFASWPAEVLGRGDHLVLCIAGDSAVVAAIEQAAKGRSIDAHGLVTVVVKADGSAAGCHLLYVGGSETRRITSLLESARGAPVFTVGDTEAFAAAGGMAQLFVENDRMRFAINLAAAERANVQLSSKLLSLAKVIEDNHHAEK